MDAIKAIFNNPKHRNILILTILSCILVGLIIYRLIYAEALPPEGSLRVVICKKCKQTFSKRIKDINNPEDKRNICEHCGGKLAIAWKCNDCQFEYPATNICIGSKKLMKTMSKFKAIVESHRCPNCGSLATHPMSINELKK